MSKIINRYIQFVGCDGSIRYQGVDSTEAYHDIVHPISGTNSCDAYTGNGTPQSYVHHLINVNKQFTSGVCSKQIDVIA